MKIREFLLSDAEMSKGRVLVALASMVTLYGLNVYMSNKLSKAQLEGIVKDAHIENLENELKELNAQNQINDSKE